METAFSLRRTTVSLLDPSIKLKPALLVNSGSFWRKSADQNCGGFEGMCNMWNSISSFMWLAWCLFLSLLRTRLVNGTVFFRAKRIIVLVFVPVGFFIFFLPPESKVFNRQSGLFSEKRRTFDECFGLVPWMIPLVLISCHRPISCFRVVLPQPEYIRGL